MRFVYICSAMRAITQYYSENESKTYYVSPYLEKITITEGVPN